jgi:hypothetical protein
MEQGTQTHTHRHRNQHGYALNPKLARTHPPRTHVLLPARAHNARRLAISLLRVCVWFQCGVYQIESAHETGRASESVSVRERERERERELHTSSLCLQSEQEKGGRERAREREREEGEKKEGESEGDLHTSNLCLQLQEFQRCYTLVHLVASERVCGLTLLVCEALSY